MRIALAVLVGLLLFPAVSAAADDCQSRRDGTSYAWQERFSHLMLRAH